MWKKKFTITDEVGNPVPGTFQVQEKDGRFYVGQWVERYVRNGWLRPKKAIVAFERLTCNDRPCGDYEGRDTIPPPLHWFGDLEQAKSKARKLQRKLDHPKAVISIFHSI